MPRKVFIWVAHPGQGSLCAGLADAYEKGATSQGAEVRRMDLPDMTFDPHFEGYGRDAPGLEPDLRRWQDGIAWADHLLIVHPYWWGAMPSRAKAVLDRALTPGFGFKYHEGGLGWDKLLQGRTADVFITSDTPPLFDTFIYGKPGRRVMRNQVLGFCGIKVRKAVQFGPVKTAKPAKIDRWLDKAQALGRRAA
ncbi:NAD(P)H-dependent oxidoreductase [Roseovarius sp. SYSU LYC5161]|uniref:NAD(P)H-dependent oxidoreductase n=1 Tax=Roseovarius halophilus (ex Wu et al. 2025) TaxID=3376060 RepID=UPI0028724C8A|nr:NAD(P)H-dependent oxidoreductase [Roseovarius sp.]